MGFLDLDADTSNLPERVPQGYFRKEKPPESFLGKLWWHIKNRPLIALAIVALPVVVLATMYLVSYLTTPSEKPHVGPEASNPNVKKDGYSSDLIEIKLGEGKGETKKGPVTPLPVQGNPSDPGKSD